MWGWKSALTHHVLDALVDQTENPHFIIVFRDIKNNAESWKLHKKLNYNDVVTTEEAINVIQKDVDLLKSTIKNYPNIPSCYTTYEDIKKNPIEEASKIASFLDIDFTEEIQSKITNFILPEYSTLK